MSYRSHELSIKLKNMSKEQEKDPQIKNMIQKQVNGNKYITKKNDIAFVKQKTDDTWKLMIPHQIAHQLTKETHELLGHPGRYKTYHMLKNTCTFKNMHQTVAVTVKRCDTCQRNKPINYRASGPLKSHKPEKILDTLSVDLMGPLPMGRGGTQFILAMLDTFSKYIKLYAIKKATTRSIINKLETDYIPNVGKPSAILTDNGTQFTAKFWAKKIAELQIKTKYSTRYHPQANPVERYNREIGRLLRTYCHNQHTKWPNKLQQIESWMNQLRSETTEETPIQIMRGIQPKQPIEEIIKFPNQEKPRQNKEELICLVANRIRNKANKQEEKNKKKNNKIRNKSTGINSKSQFIKRKQQR